MGYSFFAFINRMKYIQRWGLMRSMVPENLQEHCLQTAMIAHMLVKIDNKFYGGSLDPEKACVYALYHDATETITGDLPTPVKYFNEELRENYRVVEDMASKRLVEMLPDDFRKDFEEIIEYEKNDEQYVPYVKAADKISAYFKCIEEENCGNKEFGAAKKTLSDIIGGVEMPCVKYFMENFAPAYLLSLDELQ